MYMNLLHCLVSIGKVILLMYIMMLLCLINASMYMCKFMYYLECCEVNVTCELSCIQPYLSHMGTDRESILPLRISQPHMHGYVRMQYSCIQMCCIANEHVWVAVLMYVNVLNNANLCKMIFVFLVQII